MGVSGSTVVSDIMIIFMFYHRSNKMYCDSGSDSVDAMIEFRPRSGTII